MERRKKVKGYKVFEPDWTCKGFQYKLGGEYKMDEDIEVCKRGFHFCESLNDCFDFYNFDPKNKVAEVEALGIVKNEKGDIKSVTNHIKIIKELTWSEVCDLVNTGRANTGNRNSGDRNSGNCNSGDCNSGDRNSGDCNSGDRNSGDCNLGDWNSGDRNSGDCNSGDCNSGDRNSGYCNSGDWNSGLFNSRLAVINLFNKTTNMTMEDIKKRHETAINAILYSDFPLTKWISERDMTEEEKRLNPQYKITGGYLKTLSYKDAWSVMWGNFHKKEKEAIMKLPNFDKDIFEEITGIKL